MFDADLADTIHPSMTSRTLAPCGPAHRFDDDVEELAGLLEGAALAARTGADPDQPVDPDLDPLDVAELLQGIAHVDD